MDDRAVLDLTADIVAAHAAANRVALSELPQMIVAVHQALVNLGRPVVPVVEPLEPAVSIRSSVKPDAITCLECGARQKMIKRHLATSHGMTPDQYRARWDLPATYPIVAPNYAALRSAMAKQIGLGEKVVAKGAGVARRKPRRKARPERSA